MRRSAILTVACLVTAVAVPVAATATAGATEERTVSGTASGEFEVTLTPAGASDTGVGRMAIAKTFRGPLDATSAGQMLAVRTPVAGSAGSVAMEVVSGTLDGRRGSFALQHSGTMSAGAQSLSVTVVPDSATGELKGLSGAMTIRIEGGKHFYDFSYMIP